MSSSDDNNLSDGGENRPGSNNRPSRSLLRGNKDLSRLGSNEKKQNYRLGSNERRQNNRDGNNRNNRRNNRSPSPTEEEEDFVEKMNMANIFKTLDGQADIISNWSMTTTPYGEEVPVLMNGDALMHSFRMHNHPMGQKLEPSSSRSGTSLQFKEFNLEPVARSSLQGNEDRESMPSTSAALRSAINNLNSRKINNQVTQYGLNIMETEARNDLQMADGPQPGSSFSAQIGEGGGQNFLDDMDSEAIVDYDYEQAAEEFDRLSLDSQFVNSPNDLELDFEDDTTVNAMEEENRDRM